MTSRSRSWVLVAEPSVSVPTYSLSSLINRSWTFVPRPIVRRSSPVAMGSSVPQWPLFLLPSCRRAIATTSCEVMPSALSTRRTPSGIATDDITNFLQNFLFDFRERAANTRPGGKNVSATAKFFADGAHIHFVAFRTHAHAHFAVGQFLKENRHNNAVNRAQMIDESFIVF